MASFNLLGWPFNMGIYRCEGHSSACNGWSGHGVKDVFMPQRPW